MQMQLLDSSSSVLQWLLFVPRIISKLIDGGDGRGEGGWVDMEEGREKMVIK